MLRSLEENNRGRSSEAVRNDISAMCWTHFICCCLRLLRLQTVMISFSCFYSTLTVVSAFFGLLLSWESGADPVSVRCVIVVAGVARIVDIHKVSGIADVRRPLIADHNRLNRFLSDSLNPLSNWISVVSIFAHSIWTAFEYPHNAYNDIIGRFIPCRAMIASSISCLRIWYCCWFLG